MAHERITENSGLSGYNVILRARQLAGLGTVAVYQPASRTLVVFLDTTASDEDLAWSLACEFGHLARGHYAERAGLTDEEKRREAEEYARTATTANMRARVSLVPRGGVL